MFETNLEAKARTARALELLEYMELSDLADRPAIDLSQGEQQRVAIARSLANSPRLLLADEPTGNLDSKTSGQIMDYFERIRGDHELTMLLVTHDGAVASRADRIVRINDGRNVY